MPAKSVRRKSRRKNKTYKALIATSTAASLFILSVLFIGGLGFYKSIKSDFASASSADAFTLQDQDIYSVLFVVLQDTSQQKPVVSKLSLTFVDKNNKKFVKYNVSPDFSMEMPGRFGDEALSKVFSLASLELDEDDSTQTLETGVNILSNCLNKLFGYRIDRYVISDVANESQLTDFLEGRGLGFPHGFNKTNFTFSEFYKLYTFSKSLPEDRFITKDFSLDYLHNTDLIDEEIRDLTFDSKVAAEKKSVSVLNGAFLPGLGAFASREVQNMGGLVVSVNNASREYQTSILIVDDPESQTAINIAKTFNISKVIRKEDAMELGEDEVNRSDVVVILGLDSKEWL
ncbi:MAG: hypothetical protein ACD_22C00267G0002 [uncultured bacterium]|nr:MAG: hypothetical protein ACD_22C00267G0002 [uncultured bacterium]